MSFRLVLISVSCCLAAAIQYQYDSLAGWSGYLFFAIFVAGAFLTADSTKRNPFVLSLVGLVEIWFILDYCVYGTVLCIAPNLKIPMPVSVEDAIVQGYQVGIIALLGLFAGVFWARRLKQSNVRETGANRSQVCRPVVLMFLLFVILGFGSLIILLDDSRIIEQLQTAGFGIAPPPGMGRYSAMVFALPTTLISLWYVATSNRRFTGSAGRWFSVIFLFAVSLPPLLQGRRLVWISTIIMATYLLRVRNVYRVRAWQICCLIPFILVTFSFFEANKQHGWQTAFLRTDYTQLGTIEDLEKMLDHSIGRFDVTAALIANRQEKSLYYGLSFLEAPLYLLPGTVWADRPMIIASEVGELAYGRVDPYNMSLSISYIGELYANFAEPGVFFGLLLLGLSCSMMDSRFASCTRPTSIIFYALCLFRLPHHLVTAAYGWFPLTVIAFLPWVVACAAEWLLVTRGDVSLLPVDRSKRSELALGPRRY